MARITVEDCLEHVDNRFQLVLLASKRARHIARGDVQTSNSEDKHKPTVAALRDFASGNFNFSEPSLAPTEEIAQ